MKNRTRADDVNDLYERALPVIHSTLETDYRMTEREARDAEHDLYVWFHRFARRSGLTAAPVGSLRLPLLVAACQYGRSFQLWKHGGENLDDTLGRVLAREPQELASELVARMDREN
ncbi:MAG TPA: hypothetical protein VGQ75_09915 [Thermoanaerobaculia bacterium]|jgi:hypothetical protein|nr:hypothetical protein [Thermoanaerobaculia bacterium]HEV8609197.1 hypothetical protein [Thermoanaerobaculia bacterium]